ncbi:hypothetical protein Trydic_g22139 [Trypoxylus dichotomus]
MHLSITATMSDLGDWYRGVPFFTRYWLTLTVAFTLLGRFGLVNPYNLILLYEPLKKFQIWRLFTCIFYYPLSPAHGFQFLLNLYFLYNYSRRLETGHYGGKPADYLTLLVFNWLCAIIVGLVLEFKILLEIMVLSVLYVWCQLNKDVIVSFWFGTRFKAMYLPWVFLGFNMILSGGGITELSWEEERYCKHQQFSRNGFQIQPEACTHLEHRPKDHHSQEIEEGGYLVDIIGEQGMCLVVISNEVLEV